jgi:ferredoxin
VISIGNCAGYIYIGAGIRGGGALAGGFQFDGAAGAVAAPGTPWRVGVNVPWTVSWTAEQKFDIKLSDDFPGLVDLVQAQNPGDGLPRFAAMHITRHRLGIAYHFCHICGRRTLARDRYIFPVQSGGFVTMPDESQRYAGNVPPVHLACAKRAARLCPHLRHTAGAAVPYPSEDSRLMQRTDIMPGMEQLAKTLPRGLKIVFSCYRLYGPRFTRQVERLRAALPPP